MSADETFPGSELRIDEDRFRADFDALAQIGATGDGGVHRPSLGEAHLEARSWFCQRVKDAGLELHVDGAGNHSALLRCGPPDAPALILGSHLDSVPYGGRFDGALGVTAALESLRVVKEAGLRLPVNLEAMDFTDEEGTLVGLLGSTALAGKLTSDDLSAPRGGREALLKGLQRAGLSEAGMLSAGRPAGSLAGYLELHIEQGLRLLNAATQVGVVSAIVGIGSYRLAFLGRADHAGTAPMETRRDAALGACGFTLAAHQLVRQTYPTGVVNVGQMEFSPGAFNIVPERVVAWLEFRSPDAQDFANLEAALLDLANEQAQKYGLGLDVEFLGRHQPAPMGEPARRAFRAAAHALGFSYMDLHSGAGHDAQSLADLCPVGMIFIPSVGGISHSPREFSHWEDCCRGANVLLQAALRLAYQQEAV